MPEQNGRTPVPGLRNQLSITSLSGVGSSTLLDGLKKHFEKLPYRYVSGGAITRAQAAELGMNIERFVEYKVDHPEYDLKCDEMIAHFAKHDYMIGESRLAHYDMPAAYHVLGTCELSERAKRRQSHKDYAHLSPSEIETVSTDTSSGSCVPSWPKAKAVFSFINRQKVLE